MEKIEKQRLEQLVRLGIIPSNKLPILIQGLDSLSMGKQLLPNEREVISKYMDNLTSIMLNDTNVFNQAKLRTQKLKYQVEEITVNTGVKIFDSPEDEEEQRKGAERKLKVRASDKKERFKLLPAAVKREKRKAGVYEDILSINDTYQAVFEAALELYGVTNIRDLPEDKKAEFFIVVDSASSDNDSSDIEEDMKVKQAVGIASDKRYRKGNMSGAVDAIEKLKPGLSDHPQVKAVLKRQNENVETDIEQLDEKNVPTSPEKWAQAISQAKSKFDVYPSAYANGWAAKKYKEMGGSWKSMKEEAEQIDELSTPTLSSYVKKVGAEDKFTKKRVDGLNLALNKIKSNSTKKEEVEHIDELKTSTLLRYASKAGKDGLSKGIAAARASDMDDSEAAALLRQKRDKRYAGQNQAIRKINTRMKSGVNVGEEVELDEGRPSQRHPLEGHPYHEKSNAELVGIAKDAHAAAEAMKSHNTTAENKYRDQANDSATVRHFRKTSGTPDWYKKKYGLKEEVELEEDEVGYQHRYAVKNGKAVKDNPKMSGDKEQPYHVYADSPEHAVRKHAMKKIVESHRSAESHELVSHADNTERLYKTSHVPVAKNLEKKFKKGTYDHEKAKELWKYHADRSADSYAKEHGSSGQKGHHIFSVKDRHDAASHFADRHHDEMKAGNFHEGADFAAQRRKERLASNGRMDENELIGNQHKIDANKNGKVDAHDFKLLKAKKKQQSRDAFAGMFGGGNPADKLSIRKNTRMDENDDYYGSRDSMSKREFKRKEMEHELGHEDGRKRKSYYSKPKSYKANTPAVSVKKEEAELTFEEMTPAQKAERLRMITKAADRVQSGAAEKSVKKLAKKDMKSPGAQRGMAPLKKEVDEQIQILRKTIVEGTAREKISAYKELNNLIQEKLKGEE